jgi:hypothetical protein
VLFRSSEPITVESEVRVYDTDNPEREGYVHVRRVRYGVHFGCAVLEHDSEYGPQGQVISEQSRVIDDNPTF